MQFFESLLLVVHLLVAVTVCGLVLLQHGKGADMGAAFGSGSSGSLFGAAGSANFLSRSTAVLAAVFFFSSLGLTYLGTTHSATKDVMQQGVMGDVPPVKAGDVPTPAPAQGSAPTPAQGSTPATPPAAPASGAAPATAPAGAGSKAGDVPK